MEIQAISNAGMKQFIMSRMQDRLRRFVGVKEDLEEKFNKWFQDLYMQAEMANAPAISEGGDEEGGQQ